VSQQGQVRSGTFSARLKLAAVVLSCSLATLVCATVLLSRQSELVQDASRQHSAIAWQAVPPAVLVDLLDAEAGARGYLASDDPAILQEYRLAAHSAAAGLSQLGALAATDPTLSAPLDDIRRLGLLKLSELAEVVRLSQNGEKPAALALMKGEVGASVKSRVRADIATLSAAAQARHDASVAHVMASSIDTRRLASITLGVLLIAVILAAWQTVKMTAAQERNERALAESEQRHRAIVEDQTEFIALSDAEGALIYVNPAYGRFFSLSPDDLGGRGLYDRVDEADVNALREAITAVLSTGNPVSIETRIKVDGGQRKWVAWRYRLQHAADGSEVVHAVGRDVTLRKIAEDSLRASQEALRDLTDVFDATTDFVAQADADGQIVYLNPSARRALGIGPEQSLQGYTFQQFMTPETNQRLLEEIIPAVQRDGIWVGETGVVLPGGRSIPVNHMVISHRDAAGNVARYSSIIRDITDAVTARKALSLQTATLEGIIEAMPAMVAVCDVSLRIRLVNKSFECWRGKSRSELVGNTVEAAVGAWEYQRSLPWIERALAGETVTFEKDYPMSQAQRYVALTYIPLQLEDGTVDGFIGIAQDVTRDREENLRLQLLSQHCPLTGLLNRVGLEAFLDTQVAQDKSATLAILYIDLDHFKPINDAHGHTVGDEVLQAFAVRLQGLVRPTDAVARLGGDEFIVALTGIRKLEDAASVADEIIGMARQPIWIGPLVLSIGASVGVTFNSAGSREWHALLERADMMLYEAKRSGRGRRVLDSGEPRADESQSLRAVRARRT